MVSKQKGVPLLEMVCGWIGANESLEMCLVFRKGKGQDASNLVKGASLCDSVFTLYQL